jgi:hypothetical protein
MLFAELRDAKSSLPRILLYCLYIVGIAVMVGLALRPRSLFLFLVIWTSQHWILATGLASQTPGGEPAPRRGFVRRILHGLNIRPWAVLLFLMCIGRAPAAFEVEANREAGTYYGDRIFGTIATALRTSCGRLRSSPSAATGFIHYLLDRSVYRMSDPQRRSGAGPTYVSEQDSPQGTQEVAPPGRCRTYLTNHIGASSNSVARPV